MGNIFRSADRLAARRARNICPGCKCEIDESTCYCGESWDCHPGAWMTGHEFVPMGCQCKYDDDDVYSWPGC